MSNHNEFWGNNYIHNYMCTQSYLKLLFILFGLNSVCSTDEYFVE